MYLHVCIAFAMLSNIEKPSSASCTDLGKCRPDSSMVDVGADGVVESGAIVDTSKRSDVKNEDHEITCSSMAEVDGDRFNKVDTIEEDVSKLIKSNDDREQGEPSSKDRAVWSKERAEIAQFWSLHPVQAFSNLEVKFTDFMGNPHAFRHVTGKIVDDCDLPGQAKIRYFEYNDGGLPDEGQLVERAINVDIVHLHTPVGWNENPYHGSTVANVELHGSFVSENDTRTFVRTKMHEHPKNVKLMRNLQVEFMFIEGANRKWANPDWGVRYKTADELRSVTGEIVDDCYVPGK